MGFVECGIGVDREVLVSGNEGELGWQLVGNRKTIWSRAKEQESKETELIYFHIDRSEILSLHLNIFLTN